MASSPNLRNGNAPLPSIPNSPSPNPSIAAQGARLVAELAAKRQAAAVARPLRSTLPRHLYVEPVNLEKYLNDDPLVGTRGAAIILGLSLDLLKKWRQRNQGPEYYQYEQDGAVSYSVRALQAFKAAHLVKPNRKGRN